MADTLDPTLVRVLAAYGLPPGGATATPAPSGLIQETHLVTLADDRRVVAQRMHRIFGADVLLDIDAVTAHLAAQGLETPRPLRTTEGTLTVTDEGGRLWRLLTYLPGHTVDRMDSPARAEEAAALVARFHRATVDVTRPFAFSRPGAHDTRAHLAQLERALDAPPAAPLTQAERDRIAPLGAAILAAGRALPALPAEPLRVTHGDLKISNVLFDERHHARALLDLDTLGRLTIAYELGDALRSWCNPLGEDTTDTRFDVTLFAAAVRGYARDGRGLLGRGEVDSLVPGLITVATELAARFCADAFEDTYFGWNPQRFPSRREHNRVRAAGQLGVAQAVVAARAELETIVRSAFA